MKNRFRIEHVCIGGVADIAHVETGGVEFQDSWERTMQCVFERHDGDPQFVQSLVSDTDTGFNCIIQQVH